MEAGGDTNVRCFMRLEPQALATRHLAWASLIIRQ